MKILITGSNGQLGIELLNQINLFNKKESFEIRNIEEINSNLNFINETNNGGVRYKDLKKLRSGKFTIQSKLDLHGYKLHDAEKIFYNFVIKSYQKGNRNLLIVTGKGQDGEGKIRKSLHTWINENDLSKLVTGSFGTLLVLSEVTLKVLPTQSETKTIIVSGLALEHSLGIMGSAISLIK